MGKTYGGRWEIVESLGEGGQAHTFLVKDIRGDGAAHYALKRLKNLDRLDRFKREIEVIRNLSHENIVALVDFDLDADRPYLVTEFCEGGNLSEVEPFWQDSPLTALEIFRQICEGVDYAHSYGVIHRDLKPENIFLKSNLGPAVVGDFGICFLEEDGSRVTLTEEAVGPRLFISPELEDGRINDVTVKSDTYSLGKLLYWLLSGGRTFSREKHRERAYDLRIYDDTSPLGWSNIYMEHVNRLLDRMITNDPEDRREVGAIKILLVRTMKLVEKEFTPIVSDAGKPCTYCGRGIYQLKAKDNIEVGNFGFVPVGAPDWRVMVCSECGHVQSFRVDYAKRQEWWK